MIATFSPALLNMTTSGIAACAHPERPRRRAAEQRDELAASHHSITSSARASSVGGTSRPSGLAV
jgi:hypothetical protein